MKYACSEAFNGLVALVTRLLAGRKLEARFGALGDGLKKKAQRRAAAICTACGADKQCYFCW